MRRSGWEAPTYPSFGFRQSAERSLVLSLKLASARTLRARRSGTGPGRWVDLASLKASRPRMYALGRAGRPRSRHFTAKRWSKTKLALHILLCSSPCFWRDGLVDCLVRLSPRPQTSQQWSTSRSSPKKKTSTTRRGSTMNTRSWPRNQPRSSTTR